MPTTRAVLVYTAEAPVAPTAAVSTALAAVPIPIDTLTAIGVTVVSDVTVSLVRTITLALVPGTPATFTAVLEPGDPSGSPIASVTTATQGSGYAVPPVLVFGPGGPDVIQTAAARVRLDVLSVTVNAPGSGYTAPVVTFVGGLAPGGRPATGTVTLILGAVVAVVITDEGAGYTSVPRVVISDPTGSGAVCTAVMEVDDNGVALDRKGKGYSVVPTVTAEPFFKSCFPDTSDQRVPFYGIMKVAIEQALASPVTASAPTIF